MKSNEIMHAVGFSEVSNDELVMVNGGIASFEQSFDDGGGFGKVIPPPPPPRKPGYGGNESAHDC